MIRDITEEIVLRNGKANPFGWSQSEIWHNDQRIGWIESGAVDVVAEGYSHEIRVEEGITHVFFYVETDNSEPLE